jgi:probable rRNA maturation factor
MISATASAARGVPLRAPDPTMKDDPDPKPHLVIDVAIPCADWRRRMPGLARLVRETVAATLSAAGQERDMAEVSLVLCGDAEIQSLNRRWRGKDAPTNVLSFPAGGDTPPGVPRLLGDVVLAYETVSREAAAQGKPLAHHVRHLIVHGVLHLLGHDHEDDRREARRMESLERRILAGFRVPDPYRVMNLQDHG